MRGCFQSQWLHLLSEKKDLIMFTLYHEYVCIL